jgi:HlyD family secretion protein
MSPSPSPSGSSHSPPASDSSSDGSTGSPLLDATAGDDGGSPGGPGGPGGASGGGSPGGPDDAPDGSSTGEGIDRRIEKKTFTPKRIAVGTVALLAVAALGYAVWSTATGGQALNVDRAKLTVSTVERGPFQEFISQNGNVLPQRTVFLDAVEGGRIEEIYVREGAMVDDGERILRLSNNDLRLRVLNSEASIAEQRSQMERLKLQMEQQALSLQQQIANMEYQIRRLQRQHNRQERLYEKNLISEENYLDTRDELEYQRRRLRLTRSAYVQDSLAQESRLQSMEQTEQRLRRNYDVLRESLENLTVRAPIAGQLTALDAEIGEIISSGTRLGQVDKVDTFKIRAQVDEFYIERVRRGQTATTQPIGGDTYELTVSRVYPEVENGRFEVDLTFVGDQPDDLRRGQSVRLRLELGSPEEAVLLARGGFYQSTGGNWAYVLTEGGEAAVRRPIRLGRQNPNHFEVLRGLAPGDKVVTSNYDTFGDADRLVLE